MKAPLLGKGSGGNVAIDMERLIATRLLVACQSGGGKSWTLRRILEQTYGLAQQIIIDPEGDLFTLREVSDYVLVGPHGADCAPDARTAGLLARRLLELGVSAILDISELPADPKRAESRDAFVAKFIGSLVNAPRKLWHPALIVIDEAHDYCPERGKRSGPRTPAADAIVDLMAKGRKRGFAAMLATQRLSKLSKDAAAEAGNMVIGRHILPADVRGAAEMIGLDREERDSVKRLEPGEFYAFGPALGIDVERVTIGPVRSTHPKAGSSAPPPAPARARVREALAELGDLAQQAQAEEDERAALRGRVQELEIELRAARAGAPSAEALHRAQAEGARAAADQMRRIVAVLNDQAGDIATELDQLSASARERLAALAERITEQCDKRAELVGAAWSASAPPAGAAVGTALNSAGKGGSVRVLLDGGRSAARPRSPGASKPGGGHGRMLAVLAQHHPTGLTEAQWATLAGLKRTGGTWGAYKGRLRKAGHVEERGGLWFATEAGVSEAGEVPARPQTRAGILDHWRSRPGMGSAVKIAEAVLQHGPMDRQDTAAVSGLAVSGGSFSQYVSRCKQAGLVVVEDGWIKPGPAFESVR